LTPGKEIIMASTVAYTASLCTRKTNSSSNAKSGAACQEYYESSYNYVGIISFSGMNLANKVITGIWLTVDAAKAGYGAGSTKTVYLRKANYQSGIASGVTGLGYKGDALGTFSGSFYGNTTSYQITGALFTAMAAYIAQGNNSFTIYNPSPSTSSQGYSYNYLQWNSVTITITYEEAVSQPSVSSTSVNMGSAVTIYTNRVSTATTHTLLYTFGNTSGTIATGVGASVSWTPALTLAAQIPSATSGTCTITCQSYNGGVLTGTRTYTLTLNVPSTIVPSISSVTVEDTNSTVATRIQAYVKTLSTLSVDITATGSYGSTVTSYRTSLDGVTYTAASFTASKKLSASGDMTLTVTVTDSRGRTATYTETLTVLDYSYPSIRLFKADRCNSDGSAAQLDGTNVRYSFEGGVVSLNNKNALACVVYYKLASDTEWTKSESLPVTSYNLSATDKVLTQTFDALASYDLKVRLQDYFYYVEQAVSIGTKGVIMDFLADGTGIAFGKVAETSGYAEFGWPLKLSEPLEVAQGGTGASTAAGARSALGAVNKAGDTMTGNLSIQGYLYPSVYLLPYYNSTTNRTVFEGSYIGASSFASWEDSTGNNRRMLEVRTKTYENSMDNAVMLRVADNGAWGNYRIFHAGMVSGVPVANGGTGATTAAAALNNLGIFYAASLPSTGIDGQICLIPV
jgi:phage structural protein